MAEGLHLAFCDFQGFGYFVTHLNFPRRQTSSYLWAKIKGVYLNVMKVKEERTKYQLLNTVLPVVLVAAAGVVIAILRRRRFRAN